MLIKILTQPLKRDTSVSLLGKLKMFFLSMIALYSMKPYFFWEKTIVLLGLNMMLFGIVFIQTMEKKQKKHNQIYILMSFLLLYIYIYLLRATGKNIMGIVSDIPLFFFPVFAMIFSNTDENKYFIKVYSYLLSFILTISLFFFILYLFGLWNSSVKLYQPGYKYFLNYKFFIVVYDGRSINFFTRFQSVFTEPGHLGMITALLLYANGYNLKRKSNIILLVSCLLTFSLAAYVLLVGGVILYKFFAAKKKTIAIVFLFCAGSIGVFAVKTYYTLYPETVASKLLISRLLPDSKKGFAGNNRNTSTFNTYYKAFIKQGGVDVVIGEGDDIVKIKFPTGGNSSYKNFFLMYGVMGIFLLMIFYLSVCYKKSELIIGLLLLYILSFLQRPYALWFCELFIFMGACIHDEMDTKNISENLKRGNILWSL